LPGTENKPNADQPDHIRASRSIAKAQGHAQEAHGFDRETLQAGRCELAAPSSDASMLMTRLSSHGDRLQDCCDLTGALGMCGGMPVAILQPGWLGGDRAYLHELLLHRRTPS
jgi:hypothetical protein